MPWACSERQLHDTGCERATSTGRVALTKDEGTGSIAARVGADLVPLPADQRLPTTAPILRSTAPKPGDPDWHHALPSVVLTDVDLALSCNSMAEERPLHFAATAWFDLVEGGSW